MKEYELYIPLNDNPGMKYDKAADEDSWKRMLELFKEKFNK